MTFEFGYHNGVETFKRIVFCLALSDTVSDKIKHEKHFKLKTVLAKCKLALGDFSKKWDYCFYAAVETLEELERFLGNFPCDAVIFPWADDQEQYLFELKARHPQIWVLGLFQDIPNTTPVFFTREEVLFWAGSRVMLRDYTRTNNDGIFIEHKDTFNNFCRLCTFAWPDKQTAKVDDERESHKWIEFADAFIRGHSHAKVFTDGLRGLRDWEREELSRTYMDFLVNLYFYQGMETAAANKKAKNEIEVLLKSRV